MFGNSLTSGFSFPFSILWVFTTYSFTISKMESKKKLILFLSLSYAMLISNRFNLFNILCKDFRCFFMIKKVVVIKFSHRTQYLIATSVDITFINVAIEYYV